MNADSCIDTLIADLLNREGGFVDHPADRGGPTNMGITLDTLASWRGRPCSRDDVAGLSLEEAHTIYLNLYWEGPGFDRLNLHPKLVEVIFDTAVHSGPSRAVKLLQAAVGAREDGVLGPKTRAAAEGVNQMVLMARYVAARTAYLGRLITKVEGQHVFAAGWMKRMAEFINDIPETKKESA